MSNSILGLSPLWQRQARALVLGLGLLSFALPAHAELVVFSDGGFLTVTSFTITGERIRLELPAGGALVLPLLRIDRILADEIVRLPPVAEAPAPSPPPPFPLRFDATQPVPETPFADLIYEAAVRHTVNPALVAAVVRAESAFQPRAVSHKGAMGLMQLMPATAQRFGLRPHQVMDPAANLDAGTRYLNWLIDRFDADLPRVLAAYNAGEGTVDRYAGIPPYRETHDYIRRVTQFLGLPTSTPQPQPATREASKR